MKKYSIFIIGFLFATTLWSCTDLDTPPIDRESDLTFWDKPEDALHVLNTCYENMYNAGHFFFNETLSDNAFNRSGVDGLNSRNIAQGSFDSNHPRISNEWTYHYTGIRKCNTLLANIAKVPGLDENLRNRIIGEAKFIRAFHYFHLVTWYGAVPFFEHEISIEESLQIGRTDKATILTFIHQELDAAAASLPTNVQYTASDRGRITKGAALALKARAYLYEGNWQQVVTITEQFLTGTTAGTYALFPDYAGIFKPQNEYNSEVILDLQYMPVNRTHSVQRYFIPRTEGRLVTSIAPTQELVDSYLTINGKAITEAGSGYDENNPYINRDPRFKATIVHNGYTWTRPNGSTITINTYPGTGDNSIDREDTSPTGYYVAKYFDPTSTGDLNSGLNLILIRYADILLMHAEAKNELGQFDASVWDQTIRRLRQRAGFTDADALSYSAGNQASLREVIRRERRVELAMEGLRIFDIRRWRIAEEVLNGYVHGIKAGDPAIDNGYRRVDTRSFDPAKHYLWPIPLRERDLNPSLGQNLNW